MNRFEYCQARLFENESFVAKDRNIKLYDGDEKVAISHLVSELCKMLFDVYLIPDQL